jgi:chemotaxis protein methyltransferase CheR
LDILIPFVKKLTGIQLGRDKAYLFESRLRPLMHQLKLDQFHDLVGSCESNELLRREFIDAMTTGEVLFFRDSSPFIFLKEIYFTSFYKSHRKYGSVQAQRARKGSVQNFL